MQRESTEDTLYDHPVIQAFLDGLLERHYEPQYAPRWVNYRLFADDKKHEILENLLEHFEGDYEDIETEPEVNLHSLAFAYKSGWVDEGSSTIWNAVHRDVEVTIPMEVVDVLREYATSKS